MISPIQRCLVSHLLLVVSGLVVTVGCTSAETIQAQAEQESHLKVVSVLYGRYLGSHRGRPPADEAAFREFIEKEGATMLESFGVATVDEVMVSERDQLPYVITYAGTKAPTTPEGMEVVAYEQQGVEGKIFVANNLGAVTEIEAAQLSK